MSALRRGLLRLVSFLRDVARPLMQVALGVGAGGVLVCVLTLLVTGLSQGEVAIVAAYMTLVMAVCLLACVVPTQRALRIQPTQALKLHEG